RRSWDRVLPSRRHALARMGRPRAGRASRAPPGGAARLRRRVAEVVHRRAHGPRARRGAAGRVARRDGDRRLERRGADPHPRCGRDARRHPRGRAPQGEGGAVSDRLAAFRWRDALDILLVAIVLYRAFVMFRGTRAVQMMIGLGGLAAASLLARQLELYSTEWLLDNFWSFWVIALVVLFQPELRRALASLGQGRVGAAGCFLPLSRNLQVGRALGTRHRAALGITEETDAIAIVVSEETGRVSLAVEGQMDSPVEAGSLRQRLLALLGGTPAPAGRASFWLALRRLLPLPGKHA